MFLSADCNTEKAAEVLLVYAMANEPVQPVYQKEVPEMTEEMFPVLTNKAGWEVVRKYFRTVLL